MLITFLAICRPSGCTVASGFVVVVVVVGVCNRSQMRTSKCTCLIFGVSIGLDPGWKCTKEIFNRSEFKVTHDISPTISGWLLIWFSGPVLMSWTSELCISSSHLTNSVTFCVILILLQVYKAASRFLINRQCQVADESAASQQNGEFLARRDAEVSLSVILRQPDSAHSSRPIRVQHGGTSTADIWQCELIRVNFSCQLSSVWPGGVVVVVSDLRLNRSRVGLLTIALSGNNLGQVVHTLVPLSPSSIIWYWSQGSDVLQLGR